VKRFSSSAICFIIFAVDGVTFGFAQVLGSFGMVNHPLVFSLFLLK